MKPIRFHGSCWGEPAVVAILTRNAEHHVTMLQRVLDAVPAEWARITAHLVVEFDRTRQCAVSAACGSDVVADQACVDAVADAIHALGALSLVPKRLEWVGIWIDYDVDEGRLVAKLIHGGMRPRTPASPPLQADAGVPYWGIPG